MILEFDLAPAAEARLQERATWHGQTVTDYLLALALSASHEDDADYIEALTGIRCGMADGEAGREITLEECRAQIAREAA